MDGWKNGLTEGSVDAIVDAEVIELEYDPCCKNIDPSASAHYHQASSIVYSRVQLSCPDVFIRV